MGKINERKLRIARILIAKQGMWQYAREELGDVAFRVFLKKAEEELAAELADDIVDDVKEDEEKLLEYSKLRARKIEFKVPEYKRDEQASFVFSDKCLLIDDDFYLFYLARLDKEGIRVDVAESKEEALEKITNSDYSVVFVNLDIANDRRDFYERERGFDERNKKGLELALEIKKRYPQTLVYLMCKKEDELALEDMAFIGRERLIEEIIYKDSRYDDFGIKEKLLRIIRRKDAKV